MPIVDNIEAEFRKLIWPVSLDGRKMESDRLLLMGRGADGGHKLTRPVSRRINRPGGL
jgi:hypothetical protein